MAIPIYAYPILKPRDLEHSETEVKRQAFADYGPSADAVASLQADSQRVAELAERLTRIAVRLGRVRNSAASVRELLKLVHSTIDRIDAAL